MVSMSVCYFFQSNAESSHALSILQNHHGILALLDEECLRPGPVSDETFLYKLTQACQDNPYFESRGCRNFVADSTLPHHSFRVRHYAGAVTYSVTGFIDKNNDILHRDLSQAMYKTDQPLLKTLFPEAERAQATHDFRDGPRPASSQVSRVDGDDADAEDRLCPPPGLRVVPAALQDAVAPHLAHVVRPAGGRGNQPPAIQSRP
ncbi:Unconventional myosin-Ib [Araneus ventricosus]|uniref:Unconventional myosin-Ib n=1 Tax=Araneus ventricosus TaxID=182803 RepID=A0A4Y2WGC4_ARAVE|nr:Unconventional myosin-Ib [Araneus ventricosus]GBO40475.1 Unconventional myosin-Ib [Araneus ventricosus]